MGPDGWGSCAVVWASSGSCLETFWVAAQNPGQAAEPLRASRRPGRRPAAGDQHSILGLSVLSQSRCQAEGRVLSPQISTEGHAGHAQKRARLLAPVGPLFTPSKETQRAETWSSGSRSYLE